MTDGSLVAVVREALVRSGESISPEAVAVALRAVGRPVGERDLSAIYESLVRESRGAGPLEEVLTIPGVTDVLVNGPDHVWFDRGAGLERHQLRFTSDSEVRRLAQRLAATAGRRLDDASPHVDVRLPDGTRFHAVLPPLARPGTAISLRVPQRRAMTLAELEEANAVDEHGSRLLRRIVEARLAFAVTGGTGTGKTTLLDSLLSMVSPSERIVIVEDSSELRPDHPHVVALEARSANVEGAGAVAMPVLVRQALRMRPDRLVVGEVRGAEVVDLLAALNTGHEGGCGTLHANAAAALPARVEALALSAGLTREAAQAQLVSAFDCVIHMRRTRGRRFVSEIGVLTRGPREVEVLTAVSFEDGDTVEGPGASRLVEFL